MDGDSNAVPKLYEVRPLIRAYLWGEVERIRLELGEGVALDDCLIQSGSPRRIRAMIRAGIAQEPNIEPNAISSNYDTTRARFTPGGARLAAEIHRRCIPDGRILRD